MPKVVDRAAYTAELLERSFDLFAAQGFGAVTMRSIARHLGVSTGTLYHYFPTKQAIFQALVPHIGRGIIDRALAAVSTAPSPVERRARLVDFVDREQEALRGLLLIVLDASRHSGILDQTAVTMTTRLMRQALEEHLALTGGEASELFEALLGRVLHPLLDPGSGQVAETNATPS